MADTSPRTQPGPDNVGDGTDPSGHARRLHDHDRAARSLGIELTEAALGRATARMTVRDDMLNGAGRCHGGVIFTLADTAFQCACNSHGRLTVSSGASIQFVRAASVGDELVAVCVERFRSRSGGGYDVTVTRVDARTGEGASQLVALFRGQAHELRPAAG
ncbi:MAG: hotdog fold thioesterase [Acidimicrobiaceae bacterium]|nr:hotdog fold thioesterase [Acidimicrobiaceae bacterium]